MYKAGVKRTPLTLAARSIPVSSKEVAMLTQALVLIDIHHPYMRKQALDFARKANLEAAIEILTRYEKQREVEYNRTQPLNLFPENTLEEVIFTHHPSGTAFDFGTRRNGSRKLQARRKAGIKDQRESGQGVG